MRRETRELALCGMLCALAVALLCLGAILPLMTYAAPVLVSAALLVAREECRVSRAWACFFASAVLGLLLSPDKEAALLYAFLGHYPLLKPRFDGLRPRALRLALKLLLFTAAISAMYGLLLFVFRLEALVREAAESSPALLAATGLLGVAVFLTYDLALARLEALYRSRRKTK